jgi:hypothetical protein
VCLYQKFHSISARSMLFSGRWRSSTCTRGQRHTTSSSTVCLQIRSSTNQEQQRPQQGCSATSASRMLYALQRPAADKSCACDTPQLSKDYTTAKTLQK